MKLALLLPPKPHAKWKLAAQVGVRYAVAKLAPELTGENPPWDPGVIKRARDRFGEAGLTLYALEGDQFDMSRIKLGLPGRDDDIRLYCRMLENMGRAGVSLLCYNFMAGVGWYRTDTAIPSRGGALASGFDKVLADRQPPLPQYGTAPVERIWANWEYFISRVLPAAEQAGVVMALHPDDPPVPTLRGIGRAFSTVEAFRRAQAFIDSPANRITFCQSNFRLMGVDLPTVVREFGPRIAFVHFRDVAGTVENFVETFHDDGPTDMAAMLRLYRDVGFDGLLRPDHVPAMEGEQVTVQGGHLNAGTSVGYDILGRLFAVGYIRGLAEACRVPME